MNSAPATQPRRNRLRAFFLSPSFLSPFLLSLAAGLALCFLLARNVRPQAQSPSAAKADSAELLPWLDPKPGCWEVRNRTVMQITNMAPAKAPSTDEAKHDCQDRMSRLTPQQRAQLGPEQLAGLEKQCEDTYAVLKKAGEQNVANLKKGVDSGPQTAMTCTKTPFGDVHGDVYDKKDPAKQCTRNAADSGGVRHMHVACNDFSGDFDRIDAEHFKGTKQSSGLAADPDSSGQRPMAKTTTTFTAKWISEGQPHLPYSPPMTDLDGVRPQGPYGVGWLDPFRLVAEIDGRRFIAEKAFLLINYADRGTAETYGPALSDVFQKIYMHCAVVAMAMHLHLDQQQPWKGRIDGSFDGRSAAQKFARFDADPGRFSRYSNEWNEIVSRGDPGGTSNAELARQDALFDEPTMNLLWDAYFSQYKTKVEKDAALEKVKEKCKLTVLDPDFFAGKRPD